MTTPAAASIRHRLASMLYDALLLLAVEFFGFLLPWVFLAAKLGIQPPGAVLVVHVALVAAFYFIGLWRKTGQTLPMRTWKIRLLSINGGTPTFFQLLLRFILAWPSLLFFACGIVWAFFDRDRQFLHDRLSGTRLVMQESGIGT